MSDTPHPLDPIERDFRDALQRLIEGRPQNKTLRARAKAGKLRLNASNVALEAGRSRTLIALERCRYPAVREAIIEAQGKRRSTTPTTYTQLIANLRADVATLKAERRLLEASIATHVLARRKAEVSARRDAAEAARLRKRILDLERVTGLEKQAAPPPRLILIRGLPGSGKTTMSTAYVNEGYLHFEADQYFEKGDGYSFDGERLADAHAWCLEKTRAALGEGESVCVANVFATVDDIRPYALLGVDFQVVEARFPGRSVHEVPAEALRAMRSSWISTDRLVEELRGSARAKAQVTRISSKRGRR